MCFLIATDDAINHGNINKMQLELELKVLPFLAPLSIEIIVSLVLSFHAQQRAYKLSSFRLPVRSSRNEKNVTRGHLMLYIKYRTPEMTHLPH